MTMDATRFKVPMVTDMFCVVGAGFSVDDIVRRRILSVGWVGVASSVGCR